MRVAFDHNGTMTPPPFSRIIAVLALHRSGYDGATAPRNSAKSRLSSRAA